MDLFHLNICCSDSLSAVSASNCDSLGYLLIQTNTLRPGTFYGWLKIYVSSLLCRNTWRASDVIACDDIITSHCSQAVELTTVTSSKAAAPSRAQHKYTNNMSSIAVHSLLHMPSPLPNTRSPPPHFPSASTITMETKTPMDSLKVCKLWER